MRRQQRRMKSLFCLAGAEEDEGEDENTSKEVENEVPPYVHRNAVTCKASSCWEKCGGFCCMYKSADNINEAVRTPVEENEFYTSSDIRGLDLFPKAFMIRRCSRSASSTSTFFCATCYCSCCRYQFTGSHCETHRIKIIKTSVERKTASRFIRGVRAIRSSLSRVFSRKSRSHSLPDPPSSCYRARFMTTSRQNQDTNHLFHTCANLTQGSLLSKISTEESGVQNALQRFALSESESPYNWPISANTLSAPVEVEVEVETCVSAVSHSVTCTMSPDNFLSDYGSSLAVFTPDISVDEDNETYRFQCSCPGLYQCSVTDLVFYMNGEGDVVYKTIPWNRRLLSQHHKKPAGPLFDIKCLQQSVSQLHLPHCEILSTGGCQYLSVAHLNDEGIEFIRPHQITETHVVINITGYSGFGNVKDEDSPPDPIRALVLLFYRPPNDHDVRSTLSVLLLPKNVVLRNVKHTRKKSVGDEIYIETSPQCKLCPNHVYTLSTHPEEDTIKVQPKEAEFDEELDNNYFPSFQVTLKRIVLEFDLLLRDAKSSLVVWEREVCLPTTRARSVCAQNPVSNERLLEIYSSFIDGISEPVLNSLLDKLLEKTVITDSERESADGEKNTRDKARFVIDRVRKKEKAAQMIEILSEIDPCLCEHLGLKQKAQAGHTA